MKDEQRALMRKVLLRAARKAGASLMKMRADVVSSFTLGDGSNQNHFKGKLSLVTSADKLSDSIIRRQIRGAFPSHAILTEESGLRQGSSEWMWVVDPLDGTYNFAAGLPLFNVSIALLKDGSPEMAVVYNPLLREFFYGERDRGAFLNKKRIHVSSKRLLRNTSISIENSVENRYIEMSEKTYSAFNKNSYTNIMRSLELTLAYVAAGRLDAVIITGTHPWDFLAGALLIEEAGGRVEDLASRDGSFSLGSKLILASNKNLFGMLKRRMKMALHL